MSSQPSKPIDTPFTTEDTVIDGLPFRQSMCLERPLFPQFVQSTTYTYSYEVYMQGAAAANVISDNIAAQQDIVDTYLNGPLHDIVVRNFMDCNYAQEAEDPTDTSSSYVWVLESSPQEVDTGGKTCRGINTFPSDYACFVVHAFERIYVYDLSSQRKRRQERRQRLKQRRHLQPTSTSEEFAGRIKNFLQNQMGLGTFNNLATPSYSSTRIVYINGDGGEDDDDDNGSSSSSNYGIARPTKPPTPTAAPIVFAPSPSPTVISPTIVDDPLDVNGNDNVNTLKDNGGSKEGLSVIAFSSLVAAASFVVLLLVGGFVCTRWRRRKQKMESSMEKNSSSSSQAMKQYIQNADLEIIQEVTANMMTTTMDDDNNNNNNDNKNILCIDLVRGNTVLTDDITAADKSDESSSSPNSKTSTTSSKKQKRKSNKSYWSL